jgi:hypothetical protein
MRSRPGWNAYAWASETHSAIAAHVEAVLHPAGNVDLPRARELLAQLQAGRSIVVEALTE